VFPAGAGMILNNPTAEIRDKSVPRRRGDDPVRWKNGALRRKCSPQARG